MLNFNKLWYISWVIHLALPGGFLFLIQSAEAQSGWTKGKGELFSRVGYQYFSSGSYYNLSGNEMNTNEFIQHSVALYGEYGLTDRLTILLDWPAFKSHRFESTETIHGVGDMKIGAKYAISKKIPISLTVLPELPVARANRFAQNENPAFGSINLPTGDGEFNVFTILAGSASFYPLPVYTNVFFAYNFRTEYDGISLSDQLLYGIEIGGKVFDIAWLKGGIRFQESLDQSDEVISFIRGEGTEYASISFGLYVPIRSGWGVDINYFDYLDLLVSRKNIYDAPVFSLGIVYEIKKAEE